MCHNFSVDTLLICSGPDLCLPAPIVKVLAECMPPSELLELEHMTKGKLFWFCFLHVFFSGNVVLQIVFCHRSIETQEINIYVCMHIHSFKQNTS